MVGTYPIVPLVIVGVAEVIGEPLLLLFFLSEPRLIEIDQEVCRGIESLGEFKGTHTLNLCARCYLGDAATTWGDGNACLKSPSYKLTPVPSRITISPNLQVS